LINGEKRGAADRAMAQVMPVGHGAKVTFFLIHEVRKKQLQFHGSIGLCGDVVLARILDRSLRLHQHL